MRALNTLVGLALTVTLGSAIAHGRDPAPLVSFSGAIGVEPLTSAGGTHVTNTVRGIAPGGRGWILRKLSARIGADGSARISGRGLLLTSGEGIATRGAVTAVAATLTCGAADATARKFTTPSAALDAAGNFSIRGALSEDGVNAAVMPATCENPMLLIRSFSTTTNTAGGWFAVGILGSDDD